jgi:uncharacterized protein YjbJ (UPF0337 family)
VTGSLFRAVAIGRSAAERYLQVIRVGDRLEVSCAAALPLFLRSSPFGLRLARTQKPESLFHEQLRRFMNRDELEGKKENIKGRIKEAAGTLTGNEDLESEGADERAEGEAREQIGKATRKVGEAIENLGKKIKS